MQQDLIKQNIENIKNASLPQLLASGFQIFLTRLPIIAAVVAIVNLPIAIFYALFRTQLIQPVEFVEGTGELIVHEELIVPYYMERSVDIGVWLYGIIAILAVSFIVELTIHGEFPQLNGVINHAIMRWWDGLRTGALKVIMLAVLLIAASFIGGIAAVALGVFLPEIIAFTLGILFMFILIIVPVLMIIAFFFFDLYAASLRDVGGVKALRYSMRISHKQRLKLLGGLIFVFAAINFPLFVFRSVLTTLDPQSDPVFMVLIHLMFSILSAFSIVVYTLYFLHFDYSAVPIETPETFKNEK